MKKLIIFMLLACSCLFLLADIEDIQLDIGEQNIILGEQTTLPVQTSSLSGYGVISYELNIAYDTQKLTFLEIVKTNTLSANGMISVNEVNGILHIGAIFTNPLYGQGNLLNLKFSAQNPGLAEVNFVSAVMNTTSLMNLYGGSIYIENQPISASLSVGNYLLQTGSSFSLPIIATGLAGMNCISFQFKFRFDPAVINVISVNNSGSSSEGWEINNRTSSGLISVAGMGTMPITADGTLIFIDIEVLPTAITFSHLQLETVLFNTQPAVSVVDGRLDVYNLWNLYIEGELDIMAIHNNNPLFIWNVINSSATPFECEFQAGSDDNWEIAEYYASGWIENYTSQQLLNLVYGTALFARIRLRIGDFISPWQELAGHLIPLPGSAVCLSPLPNALNVILNPVLSWQSGLGDPPLGYRLYFGTNTPPSNIVNGTDLGLVTTWQPSSPLQYNIVYYWQIIPYNTYGEPSSCPIWSFTTHDANAIVQYPYLKDFYDGSVTSGGWTTFYSGSAGSNWRINTTNGISGSKCITVGRAPGTYWYISPAVINPNCGSALSFYIKDYSSNSTYDIVGENLEIMLSTTGSTPQNFTHCLLSLDNFAVTTSYISFTVDLTQFASQSIYLAFKRVSNNGNYLFIDNIQLEQYIPQITLNTSVLVFPTLKPGQTANANFSISNSGTGILSGNLIYPEGFFGVNSFSGNSNTIEVSYHPWSTGGGSYPLQITSSGGNTILYLQANCGEEIQPCESLTNSGYIDNNWQLSSAEKHNGSSSWTTISPEMYLISSWMQGGNGKGFGFWAKANSASSIAIYLNSTGYAIEQNYLYHSNIPLDNNWTYHRISFSDYIDLSVSVKLVCDSGIFIDDIDMSNFLAPQTPEVLITKTETVPTISWLPTFNCLSYNVYASSNLTDWSLISPANFQETLWVDNSQLEHRFFKVCGVNGKISE